MSKRIAAAKNYLFTLNNYTHDELSVIASHHPDKFTYIIYGKEVAPTTGTPHLQGYVQCKTKQRMTALTKLIPRASWKKADGTPEQNITYCSKEGDVTTIGDVTVERQRTDLQEFRDTVKAGTRDVLQLNEEFPEILAKYPRYVKLCCDLYRPRVTVESHPLYGWQMSLNIELKRAADRRTIHFVVDYVGNKGKSWFADYYCSLHDDAQVVMMGKSADIALAVNPEKRVFFFDITRDQCEYMNYSILESLKNGRIFSPKYESSVVYLAHVPHVVVLMNHDPDETKLSMDRYNIIKIK